MTKDKHDVIDEELEIAKRIAKKYNVSEKELEALSIVLIRLGFEYKKAINCMKAQIEIMEFIDLSMSNLSIKQ